MDSSELKSSLNDLKSRIDEIRDGTFNVPKKERRLKESPLASLILEESTGILNG